MFTTDQAIAFAVKVMCGMFLGALAIPMFWLFGLIDYAWFGLLAGAVAGPVIMPMIISDMDEWE